MFNFKKERLVKDSIGQGSFGEVFPYQKDSQDCKWVVKRTKAKKIEDLLKYLPEIVLGFSCDHPCIVPVRGYSIESKDNKYNIYMKLPRMAGGNLADELKRRGKKDLYFNQDELVRHFYSLVSAVDYLHSKRISHSDIKINNILLDEKGNLKICDIGSGKFVADEDHYNTMTAMNGAVNYKAPEIIQHERAYNLKSKSEKKDQPTEHILKREHLYLADAWSLGLTILEICMLESKLINPYDSVQLIEEKFQKLKKEAGARYQDTLLEIIFDLLQTDPTQRLKVSAVKAKLEENFPQILTKDFKASLGLQKQENQQNAPEWSSFLKNFHEKADEIIKSFEDDKKAKDNRLDKFEETFDNIKKKLDAFNLGIEKIKAGKKQELEEISKRYEESIQILKQENLALLSKIQNQEIARPVNKFSEEEKLKALLNMEKQQELARLENQRLEKEKQALPKKPRDEIVYQKKLDKVSAGLSKTWNSWLRKLSGQAALFEFRSKPRLLVTTKREIDDKILGEITQDIIKECSKENIWEELEQLDLRFGDLDVQNEKITDEGLKTFASQLFPKLSNLRHLDLFLPNWTQITDRGFEALISQLAPKITETGALHLNFRGWNQVSDHGLKILASQLGPRLVNVKNFGLVINHWMKITDDGLKIFAHQFLPHLAKVHELLFYMTGCTNITNEGLKALILQFGPKFANIKTLRLNFSCLDKITSLSSDALANQINQSLTNLEVLYLDFSECRFITTSDLQRLRDQLKMIPNFQMKPSK